MSFQDIFDDVVEGAGQTEKSLRDRWLGDDGLYFTRQQSTYEVNVKPQATAICTCDKIPKGPDFSRCKFLRAGRGACK
jgi:hypothetical protein